MDIIVYMLDISKCVWMTTPLKAIGDAKPSDMNFLATQLRLCNACHENKESAMNAHKSEQQQKELLCPRCKEIYDIFDKDEKIRVHCLVPRGNIIVHYNEATELFEAIWDNGKSCLNLSEVLKTNASEDDEESKSKSNYPLTLALLLQSRNKPTKSGVRFTDKALSLIHI